MRMYMYKLGYKCVLGDAFSYTLRHRQSSQSYMSYVCAEARHHGEIDAI